MTAGHAPLAAPALGEIRAARAALPPEALDARRVRLDLARAPCEVWLQLENLQPIGSYALRAAGAAIAAADPGELERGLVTASTGNVGQAVAWHARRRSVPCRVFAPDPVSGAQRGALRRLGAEIDVLPHARWWELVASGGAPARGFFVHPFADRRVIAGAGTIGLEIAEALPDVDAVVVPFGGGALATGIAAALRDLAPSARVFAAEIETAAPLAAALEAGEPVAVERSPSWVDAWRGDRVPAATWPLARDLLAGSIVVTLEHAAAAVRLLASRHHVVAEGAAATSLAAALTGAAGPGKVVCVVSGGHLDTPVLARILEGRAG